MNPVIHALFHLLFGSGNRSPLLTELDLTNAELVADLRGYRASETADQLRAG
jgi:hypothetical protein